LMPLYGTPRTRLIAADKASPVLARLRGGLDRTRHHTWSPTSTCADDAVGRHRGTLGSAVSQRAAFSYSRSICAFSARTYPMAVCRSSKIIRSMLQAVSAVLGPGPRREIVRAMPVIAEMAPMMHGPMSAGLMPTGRPRPGTPRPSGAATCWRCRRTGRSRRRAGDREGAADRRHAAEAGSGDATRTPASRSQPRPSGSVPCAEFSGASTSRPRRSRVPSRTSGRPCGPRWGPGDEVARLVCTGSRLG
jgi:hypothetical protein